MRILIIVAITLLLGCSSPAPTELDPVFVVMCPDLDPAEVHHPCCTGFALGDRVVTANHCVPGDGAELVSNRQWVDTSNASQFGSIVARDEALDIAWLTAKLDGSGLQQGGAVAPGDSVRALTRSGGKPGTVAEYSGSYWTSTLDTKLGDSGSAIVNASGKAVGVLTQCLVANGEKQCAMNTGIFAELP